MRELSCGSEYDVHQFLVLGILRVAEITHGSLDGVLSTFFWSLDDHNCADDAI
jgi:hypothetical protein